VDHEGQIYHRNGNWGVHLDDFSQRVGRLGTSGHDCSASDWAKQFKHLGLGYCMGRECLVAFAVILTIP